MKGNKKPFGFLTCYDAPMAKALSKTSIDGLLVGDSLGEVLYGMPTTQHVTLDMMVLHTRAVAKAAAGRVHVMADLPYRTYETPDQAMGSSSLLLGAGADSVKLENPKTVVVERLRLEGMAVCGHVGLTPQTNPNYKQQGRTKEQREQILNDAKRLQDAGCFMLVVEAVPSPLAEAITNALAIPTLGIAAGTSCDGQIRVHYDVLGLTTEERSYVVRYEDFFGAVGKATEDFLRNVRQGKPS